MAAVKSPAKAFFITSPHSGERVPDEAPWLKALPEVLLMFDVDRYVDQLYQPVIEKLAIPFVKTEWHRYAIDLNRLSTDIDCDSVVGDSNPSGRFPRGLHWSITTMGERLMPSPMSRQIHDLLVAKCFAPFHREVAVTLAALRARGASVTYHLDAHSMPSVGTKEHRDPGERRADIVLGDCDGQSCSTWYKEVVEKAYVSAGFKVAYNWPYRGGRLTEVYGQPQRGQECIQVELNRALYMNEKTKEKDHARFSVVQQQLQKAVSEVFAAMPNLP